MTQPHTRDELPTGPAPSFPSVWSLPLPPTGRDRKLVPPPLFPHHADRPCGLWPSPDSLLHFPRDEQACLTDHQRLPPTPSPPACEQPTSSHFWTGEVAGEVPCPGLGVSLLNSEYVWGGACNLRLTGGGGGGMNL